MNIWGHEYNLSTEHPASSYGLPVLVDEEGNAYGQADCLPDAEHIIDWLCEPASTTVLVAVARDEKAGTISKEDAASFRQWAKGGANGE